jgi:imidazolonepropionase-like amidohydrolase
MKNYLFLLFASFSIMGFSQENFPTNGVRDKNHNSHAFINATVYVDAEKIINDGYLFIKEGRITYVGPKTQLPENCVVHDVKGKHIYPSFIDLYTSYGIEKVKKSPHTNYPQYNSLKKGAYSWNQAIKTEINGIETFTDNEKSAKEYRNIGFGTVLSHQQDGIARGTSVLTNLAANSQHHNIVLEKAAAHYSFKKGSSRQAYPSSLMGCIALLKQTFLDAKWYHNSSEDKQRNLSLEAFTSTQSLPQIFDVRNKYSVLRADKIGDEFNVQYIFKGSGDEYQMVADMKATNGEFIVPLNFPKAYDVEDPYDARHVSLEEMKHWELAPSNPKFLEQNKIVFALTADGLKKKSDFLKNLRKAVKMGLSKKQALKSLTQVPAEMMGIYTELGSLTLGKQANFIITSGDVFEQGESIHQNWIKGQKHEVSAMDLVDIRGVYNLNVNQNIRTLKVTGSEAKPSGKLTYDVIVDSISVKGDLVLDSLTGKPYKVIKKKSVKVTTTLNDHTIAISYQLKGGVYRLSGNVNFDSGVWDGRGQIPNGEWVEWTAIRSEKHKKKKKELAVADSITLGKFNYPMMAYGWDSLPVQKAILIKNATVWTLEEQGTLETDLLIRGGKIAHIGKIADVVDGNTLVIDAKGKHVSPGIIDEHSHIAIERGVNEGSSAVTAEVRIGDVIKPNDINIYRQLSGGVTASQLLHGSANPIGGQAALIKLRWGNSPEQMKVDNAPGFIKFALGENVKQSNWGSYNTIRFPQTRMGVEQVFYDAFINAQEYEKKWSVYNELPKKKKQEASAPRRDLQTEAVLEILNAQRFVTCHSYVQSEINMLMHVADSMKFRLNTFTHILEGYKVADKMKAHGAGGSTFSDWWAYKFEVNDAIPHNASLLNQMGIVTAINSDDAEMGRRLNQEAAKGIKYGGMTEEDALKMVTLNPAILLHVEERMGSIKVGKDADLVVWSDNPLSVYAKAEQTIIDGIVYYDWERDLKMRKEIQQERLRIITKMIEEKNGGAETQKAFKKKSKVHVCGTLSDDGN